MCSRVGPAVTMNRMAAWLLSDGYQFKESHVKAFEALMLHKTIPQDLVFATMSQIANSKFAYKRRLIAAGTEMNKMLLQMFKKD